MCTAGFPEPYAFSRRVYKALRDRRDEFDLVHDNQCLGSGLLGFVRDDWPFVNTLHHPITVDRDLDLAAASGPWRRMTLRRWYGFLRMQMKVARQVPRHITVSENSKKDIAAQMGVDLGTLQRRAGRRRPGTVPSAPAHRTRSRTHADDRERRRAAQGTHVSHRGAGEGAHRTRRRAPRRDRPAPAQERGARRSSNGSGSPTRSQFVSGITDERVVELYAEAEIAVVPSLYEGFSLPAIEAMACGVPLVTTTGGALPEVVGPSGGCAMTVPTADAGALAHQLVETLDDPDQRARLGEGGRRRVLDRFTWRKTAEGTAEQYYLELEAHARRRHDRA